MATLNISIPDHMREWITARREAENTLVQVII